AFDGLPDGVLTSLLDDPTGALANVLLYHVVGGTALSTDLSDGQEVLTLQGETVTVAINGAVITINGAEVTLANLEASNGVVHVIDAVLVPELCTVPSEEYVNGFFGGGNVAPAAADGVCPIIFSDFEAWASEVYNMTNFVAGTTYTFGLSGGATGAWVPQLLVVSSSTGEVVASGDPGDLSLSFEVPVDGDYGLMIHEVGFCGDQSGNLDTDNGFPYLTCESSATITDIVVASEIHTTLETAVIAAGLDGVLAGEGPFTLFAPTDAAFEAVDADLLATILDDPSGLLTQTLQHHVVSGIAYSTDLSDGQAVPTLNGEDVTVAVDAGTDEITITSALGTVALVITADIVASNGVVHVVDAVLAPTVLSVDQLRTVENLSVFPNPTNNQFTLDIELNASERVSVDLINVVGQVVKSIDLGNRSAGLNREYIDVNDLSEGIYFMNLTVGDDQATIKVQVVR
ncbi:MAG: fasciclin domain-containing protein, partial [Cryomorphaceae bacterium]